MTKFDNTKIGHCINVVVDSGVTSVIVVAIKREKGPTKAITQEGVPVSLEYVNGVGYTAKKLTENIKLLTDSFEILDALRGSISGNYNRDLCKLFKSSCVCSKRDYEQAESLNYSP